MGLEAAAFLAFLALLNLATTWAIQRLDVLTNQQKLLQVLLVWVVPLVGAVFGSVFAYVAMRDAAEKKSSFPPANESDLASDGPGLCETNFGCGESSGSCGGGD